ncbi:hypothetical protein JMJ55_15060 [Belnapia sp. T6]|uniref:Uncharacterized protein n=1 Tax=Belnapia mucosa TaxID=2804532 RepID=A0ABS1V8I5_9PROT|nr:hypothetical protein [Belnapia mucosa]MBL6456653.1 hypothetical protein [Belnapia mucosa]
MTFNEVQSMAMRSRPTTAGALLRMARLTEAERVDLGLFIAPRRLLTSRRMLRASLFLPALAPDPGASNDN